MKIFRQIRQRSFLVPIFSLATIMLTVALAFSATKKASITSEVGLGQCRPCHLNIEKTKVKGIKFSHKAHFSKNVNCGGCHFEFPHFRERVTKVEMEICFNCHGSKHNGKEIASGKCTYCHVKSFRLRPSSHGQPVAKRRKATSGFFAVSNWEKKGHIEPSKKDISRCYMCHKMQQCFDCHKAKNVLQSDVYNKAKEQQNERLKKSWKSKPNRFPKEVLDEINSGVPVRASFCFPCHGSTSMRELAVAKDRGLIYNHEAHFKKGIRCVSCHQVFPHQNDKLNYVAEEICHYCHGVQHGTSIIAPRKCGLCHPPGYKLTHSKLPIELKKDWKKRHGEVFKAGKINCYRCHTNNDCIKCHLVKNVRPKTHRKFPWALRHGERPSAELKSCQICHEEEWCLSCHKTTMPHPPLWFRDHNAPSPRNRDCYICHKQSMCQDCHHESGLKLNRLTCKKCHKTLDTATLLVPSLKFNHQPHFERKVVCTKCHTGEKPGKKEVFTMESCYSKNCHGFKAKAPGACMFCHPLQFDLVPKSHKIRSWNTRVHSKTALKSKKSCEICHTEQFCFNCHQAPMPHPNNFEKAHGTWASRNVKGCLRCHKKLTTCKSCHHKEWVPGTDWKKGHSSIVKDKGASDCFECHNPVDCATCHLTGKSKYGF